MEEYISGEKHQELKNTQHSSSKRVTLPVSYIWGVIVLVVFCALSFYGGVAYQKHKSPATLSSTQTSHGGFAANGGFSGAHRAGSFGQVTSVSSTSITVNNQRTGASSTYTINSSTVITDNGQTASVGSIQTGDTVAIMTASSAPTVATRILVNPSFGGGYGGGASAQGSGGGSQTTD